MEKTVDAAAVHRPPGGTGESGFGVAEELVERATAIARGQQRWGRQSAPLPRDVGAGLRRLDARARRLPRRLGQVAAFDFLGDAVALASVEQWLEPGEARSVATAAADALGAPPHVACFVVLRRALASTEYVQLPAPVAAELAVSLLVELAPAVAASLWTLDADGSTICVAADGKAPQSRGIRDVVRGALDGVVPRSGQIRVQLVDRWDRPYAALVARGRGNDAAHLDPYLAEAASALAPALERAADVDRGLERERHGVAAVERRLTRLAFDLHDGPLQEIVALAEDLRLASTQIERVVPKRYKPRVRGCVDDLHARLGSLDESLREIARATSSTTAAAIPVEEALESELEALARTSPIETALHVEGDLDGLTNSQKIVLYRVVQEALSNVRKHSGANTVTVVLRSTRRFLDLTIRDDGCGFDPHELAGGRLGLAGLTERVRLLGGAVDIESRPGAGAKVRATLPQWRPSPADDRAGVAEALPAL